MRVFSFSNASPCGITPQKSCLFLKQTSDFRLGVNERYTPFTWLNCFRYVLNPKKYQLHNWD